MKRSSKVTLTVVAAMGLVSCSRRHDPCEPSYFDQMACSDAVRSGGYYWRGGWVPMTYSYPYPYYYDSYRTHVQRGGKVFGTGGAFARPSGAPSSGGTVRGGFGSTGAGHGAGA
jgi:hypothetical protein